MISDDGTSFKIKGGYINTPPLDDKTVIIVDPMLATGSTLIYLLSKIAGIPKKIMLFVAIASEYGIKTIEENYPDVQIFAGALDKELNKKGYIIPGLGDAGDLAFGVKL